MHLLQYFLPNRCLVCDLECSASLCARCWPEVVNYQLNRCRSCFKVIDSLDPREVCVRCQLHPTLITRRRYLWEYGAVTRDFINTLKYRPSRTLCQLAGQILFAQLNNLFIHIDWEYKLAVPSDRKMLSQRGFNQVDLISKLLPGVNISTRLNHLGYRSAQASLNHQERLKNVQNVFKFEGRLDGGKVLLVDDMVTTGATVDAISKELMSAGVQKINLLSLSSKY